jgi:hypothetical protein
MDGLARAASGAVHRIGHARSATTEGSDDYVEVLTMWEKDLADVELAGGCQRRARETVHMPRPNRASRPASRGAVPCSGTWPSKERREECRERVWGRPIGRPRTDAVEQ